MCIPKIAVCVAFKIGVYNNDPKTPPLEIVIRPMMYLALSYDHRLLDGKEAVSFLIAIKDQLESPEKLLLNL